MDICCSCTTSPLSPKKTVIDPENKPQLHTRNNDVILKTMVQLEPTSFKSVSLASFPFLMCQVLSANILLHVVRLWAGFWRISWSGCHSHISSIQKQHVVCCTVYIARSKQILWGSAGKVWGLSGDILVHVVRFWAGLWRVLLGGYVVGCLARVLPQHCGRELRRLQRPRCW